jgi:hypothetical protein
MTSDEKDRWLPKILIGECKPTHHRILLSSSPTRLVNNVEGLVGRHPFIVAWQNFFARKYPDLIFRTVPLYCSPMFPGLWTDAGHQCVDAASDFQGDPVTSIEAIEVLISWIGRAMVKNTLQSDEDSTRLRAGSYLRVYIDLHPDLVHAMNVTLLDGIAHGLQNWKEPVERAGQFLHDTLLMLRDKAGEQDQFSVELGNKPTHSNASAHHWLPVVRARPRVVAVNIRPPLIPYATSINANDT